MKLFVSNRIICDVSIFATQTRLITLFHLWNQTYPRMLKKIQCYIWFWNCIIFPIPSTSSINFLSLLQSFPSVFITASYINLNKSICPNILLMWLNIAITTHLYGQNRIPQSLQFFNMASNTNENTSKDVLRDKQMSKHIMSICVDFPD